MVTNERLDDLRQSLKAADILETYSKDRKPCFMVKHNSRDLSGQALESAHDLESHIDRDEISSKPNILWFNQAMTGRSYWETEGDTSLIWMVVPFPSGKTSFFTPYSTTHLSDGRLENWIISLTESFYQDRHDELRLPATYHDLQNNIVWTYTRILNKKPSESALCSDLVLFTGIFMSESFQSPSVVSRVTTPSPNRKQEQDNASSTYKSLTTSGESLSTALVMT